MDDRFLTLRADGITLVFDRSVGHIRSLEIERDGRRLSPLHTAPWVDDPAVAADPDIPPNVIPPNVRALSGDFLCAPFGGADEDGVPPHGWPANSPWTHVGTAAHSAGGTAARFRLDRTVAGAAVEKELTLRDGHPFVYQRHTFIGGEGAIPVATHAMTRLGGGGRLASSQKARAETPDQPLEPDPARGRFALRYPATTTNLAAFPRADGGTADLTRFPFASAHEEFVALLEAPGSALGWTAVSRDAEDDIVLSLKDPATFPLTMLWVSNGGRDYPPWNGRHTGVVGIEEGRTFSLYGRLASTRPNPLSDAGVPTTLRLRPDGVVEVRHVLGGLPRPTGWTDVARVEAGADTLTLVTPDGATVSAPFDGGFLRGGEGAS